MKEKKKRQIPPSYERLTPGSPAFLRAFRRTGAQVRGIDDNTGSYSSANLGPTKPGDPIGQYLYMKQLTWEREQQVSFVEEERLARAQLQHYGGTPTFPFRLPKTAPPEAQDVQTLLQQIHFYRDWLRKGEALNAAWHARQVERIALRIQLRPYAAGLQQAEALHDARRERREKAQNAKDAAVALIATIRKDYPLAPAMWIYKQAAQALNKSVRQILRYRKATREKI